jgi:hypothetical protein
MTKPKKEPPSLWERSEYDVISETATETELIAVLKTRFTAQLSSAIFRSIPKRKKKSWQLI